MSEYKNTLLRIPQGTEGFYLEEAFRHRRLVSRMEELFYHWGYLPVQTPVFDFYDVYEPLLSSEQLGTVYRMIDREGDLLMLRSDVTLFLAKQMGTILESEDLPVRVYYGDTILRHQDPEDISKNEFFQSGVELIGKHGIEGDLEVLLLLANVLQTLGVPEYYCHMGSRKLLAAACGRDATEVPFPLIRAVVMREREAIGEQLAEMGHDEETSEALAELFQFIGDATALDETLRRLAGRIPERAITELQYLSELYSQLEQLDAGGRLRIDLSEVGNQPYHSGVAFQVYVDGIDSAVSAGGRYDGLLSAFGFDAPSVGFSLMLRKLQPIIERHGEAETPREPAEASGDSFAERYRHAQRERAKGNVVTL